MQQIIGGDIGGTNLRFALIDRDGKIIKKASTVTPDNKQAIAEEIISLIEKVSSQPSMVAIGVGGLVDFLQGKVIYTPNFDFSDIQLKKLIQKRFKVACLVDNDANTAAWGEKIYGSAKKAKNFICVTLGTGIGGGLVINNKIYRGSYFAAGEIGHTTIGYAEDVKTFSGKCDYENLASGKSLGKLARNEIQSDSQSLILTLAKGIVENINGRTVTKAAKKGDKEAIKLLERHGEVIGIGLANLVNVFDPELVVLTGGLATAGELILPGIERALYERIFAPEYRKPKLVVGELGADAGIIGAAAMGFYPNG